MTTQRQKYRSKWTQFWVHSLVSSLAELSLSIYLQPGLAGPVLEQCVCVCVYVCVCVREAVVSSTVLCTYPFPEAVVWSRGACFPPPLLGPRAEADPQPHAGFPISHTLIHW